MPDWMNGFGESGPTCSESVVWDDGWPAFPYPWPCVVNSRPVRSTAARQFLLLCMWEETQHVTQTIFIMWFSQQILAGQLQIKNLWYVLWGWVLSLTDGPYRYHPGSASLLITLQPDKAVECDCSWGWGPTNRQTVLVTQWAIPWIYIRFKP